MENSDIGFAFIFITILIGLFYFFYIVGVSRTNSDYVTKQHNLMIKNGEIDDLKLNQGEFPFDVYVINLERDKDRWENVQNEMKKVGITNYHRWDAIDGKKIDNSDLYKYGITQSLIDKQGKGIASCAASHVSLLKHISDNNLGWTLILEDDIHFHPKFKSLFSKYWNETPTNSIIVYPGYDDRKINFSKNDIVFSFGTYCAHSYMVNSYGARYLLQLLNKIEMAIDEELVKHFDNLSNVNKSFCFNGDIPISYEDDNNTIDIIPHDYKRKNGDKCLFSGLIYQNRKEMKSNLR